MCGRFAIISPAEELAEFFQAQAKVAFSARYNIAPGTEVPIVSNKPPRTLEMFRWGFLTPWAEQPVDGHKLINARSETAHEKASFKKAFRMQRCIVPADGFYEWKKQGRGKQPMLIRRRDEKPMALAGLWSRWKDLFSFTILTCEPNGLMAPIHDRMPVILERPAWESWLRPEEADLRKLLQACPEDMLQVRPVSTAVNAVRNEGSALWKPPSQVQQTLF